MKVTLLKDHTHDDKRYAAGQTIDVSETDAKWLAEHKVIDAPAEAKKPAGK